MIWKSAVTFHEVLDVRRFYNDQLQLDTVVPVCHCCTMRPNMKFCIVALCFVRNAFVIWSYQ